MGDEKIPRFNTPEAGKEDIPKFTPPKSEESIPRFTAPGNGSSSNNEGGSSYDEIPSFRSPERSSPRIIPRGQACSYHPHNIATTKCASCGRPICDDCKDIAQNELGYICYDCASEMVSADIELGKERRNKVIIRVIIGIIGAIVCGILSHTQFFINEFESTSYGVGVYRFLFILFGAAIPIYFPLLGKLIKLIWRFMRWRPISYDGIIGSIFLGIKIMVVMFAIVGFFMVFSAFIVFSPVVALILAIVDLTKFIRANKLIERNIELLKNMNDYLEIIREKSEQNSSIDEIVRDSRMQGNSFAQAVMRDGYDQARKNVTNVAREIEENDRQIKKFIVNEYGEAVRAA